MVSTTKSSGVSVPVTEVEGGLSHQLLGLERCVSQNPSNCYWIKVGKAGRAIIRKEELSLLEKEVEIYCLFLPHEDEDWEAMLNCS